MAKKPTKPTKTIEEWKEELRKLFDARDFEELRNQVEICIQEYPNQMGAYIMRGVADYELGNHEEAIKDFDKAIELEPDDAFAYNNRGTAKGKLGRYEEAIKDYDKALKLDPNFTGAIQNKSLTFAKIEAEKSHEAFLEMFQATLNEIKNEQQAQPTEITDPQQIIKKYQSEIDETRYRLYGKNILYHPESYEHLSDETKNKINKMKGLVREAQTAYKWSRYALGAIAFIVIVLLVLTHSKHSAGHLKHMNILELIIGRDFSPLTPLNLLQFTTITFLLFALFSILTSCTISCTASKRRNSAPPLSDQGEKSHTLLASAAK